MKNQPSSEMLYATIDHFQQRQHASYLYSPLQNPHYLVDPLPFFLDYADDWEGYSDVTSA